MAVPQTMGKAFNRTRRACLATQVSVADTHWSRLRGLMGTGRANFGPGQGLWIVPSHGVHTLGMRFPIDVVYLDGKMTVVHVEKGLRPWRVAPVSMRNHFGAGASGRHSGPDRHGCGR